MGAQYLFILSLFLQNIGKKHFHYLIKEKTVFFKIDLLKFEALILAAKNLL
jgi:hypothetical protein